MAKSYYRLGEDAKGFFDPITRIRFKNPKQVIELSTRQLKSKRLQAARKGGAIVPCTEEDLKEWQKIQGKNHAEKEQIASKMKADKKAKENHEIPSAKPAPAAKEEPTPPAYDKDWANDKGTTKDDLSEFILANQKGVWEEDYTADELKGEKKAELVTLAIEVINFDPEAD